MQDWKSHVLRRPDAARALRRDLGLRQPYMDPNLCDPAAHGQFISDLLKRGMARRSPAHGREGALGASAVNE